MEKSIKFNWCNWVIYSSRLGTSLLFCFCINSVKTEMNEANNKICWHQDIELFYPSTLADFFGYYLVSIFFRCWKCKYKYLGGIMGFLVKILILAGIGNIGKSLPQLPGFRQVIFWVKWTPDLQRERYGCWWVWGHGCKPVQMTGQCTKWISF